MGRPPVANRATDGVLNKGPWTEEEDAILTAFVKANGEGNWRTLPKLAGLQRCRKSCRLRWMNYLRPDLKRGNFSPDEDELIVKLHSLLGNRWSLIAGRIPGRTDNEIKNYWNSRLRRKLNTAGMQGERVEAQPLSCNEVAVSSSSSPIEAIANHPGDSSSIFPEGLVAAPSGSLQDLPSTFPEYARLYMSNEATPSEPCSSEGIDDCSDHAGYYSTWTPSSLDEVANADSVKHDSSSSGYAYSPESVLPQLDSGDDSLFSDFLSFTNGLADLGDTTFQKLLHSMPLSPLHKNLGSMPWPAFYSGDSF